MPVPLAKLALLRTNKIIVGSYWQDVELQTPITLVLVEAFILL